MRERKSLSWSEPSFFKRKDRGYPWPPKYAHVVFAFTSLIFLLVPIFFPPQEGFIGAVGIVAMGIVFGALGGYGISALDLFLPAEISIGKTGITRIDSFLITSMPILAACGYRFDEWRWNEITRGILQPCADDRLQYVLMIEGHDNQMLGRLGVPQKININELAPLFENAGKILVLPKPT